MTFAEAVDVYVQLRDAKAKLKEKFDDEVAVIQKKLDTLEVALLGKMDENGAESVKTPFGTAYISLQTRASVADKDVFMTHCQDNDDWGLLEVRASKAAVEQYVEQHNGELPPGINWSAERVVNIRRKS